jgi:hypothetical protein
MIQHQGSNTKHQTSSTKQIPMTKGNNDQNGKGQQFGSFVFSHEDLFGAWSL